MFAGNNYKHVRLFICDKIINAPNEVFIISKLIGVLCSFKMRFNSNASKQSVCMSVHGGSSTADSPLVIGMI